jgi:putative pre-16S rRNA nuclease
MGGHPQASEHPGRILAIDFGMRRLGLAVSDALGITAQGLPTIERTRLADDFARLEKVIEEYSVERVILGHPRSLSGAENAMSERVVEFAAVLERRIKLPVELWDERWTSVEANRMLRESGMGIEKRRRAADRVAATLLLQSHLDFRANERARALRSSEKEVEA